MHLLVHDIKAFDMSELHLFPGVLNLFDLKLHLVKVSFELLFVLGVADVNLLKALRQLILLPLDLDVGQSCFIQLLGHPAGKPFDDCLYLGDA